ncbi:MAG TPA: A/G-specific adenine glycosylase [Pseudolabrys sp.]|nr:A/G-specific adenine glycosylase [Pseudolabrys sp.]
MSLPVRLSRRKKPVRPDPADLLAWYDRNARVLPWRAPPGCRPDAYRVWLSEIMLQQTTVKAVVPYYAKFLAKWPTVETLARAPRDEVLRAWAGLGYYARARNLHACARAITAKHGARFPDELGLLRALPGIGEYTASAIAAIAFERPEVPVDANGERVVSRLFAVEEKLPAGKSEIRRLAHLLLPPRRFGDFAQALMDLGATICSPKRPDCARCPWSDCCVANARGDQESFPRKPVRHEGRLRRGAAFVAIRADGSVLLRPRAEKGLLGGMTEVPGSEWSHDFNVAGALRSAPSLAGADWRPVPGVVRHVFTHFPLELAVFVSRVPRASRPPGGSRWVKIAALAGEALPNVMRKVLAHALDHPYTAGTPAAAIRNESSARPERSGRLR